MLMALSNFGNAISKYIGTGLVLIFGVTDTNYDNFIWVVVAKSVIMLSPVLLVPCLIPDGCPQDDEEEDEEGEDEDNTLYSSLRKSLLRPSMLRHRPSAASTGKGPPGTRRSETGSVGTQGQGGDSDDELSGERRTLTELPPMLPRVTETSERDTNSTINPSFRASSLLEGNRL
jgi:hypothetical protein